MVLYILSVAPCGAHRNYDNILLVSFAAFRKEKRQKRPEKSERFCWWSKLFERRNQNKNAKTSF